MILNAEWEGRKATYKGLLNSTLSQFETYLPHSQAILGMGIDT